MAMGDPLLLQRFYQNHYSLQGVESQEMQMLTNNGMFLYNFKQDKRNVADDRKTESYESIQFFGFRITHNAI